MHTKKNFTQFLKMGFISTPTQLTKGRIKESYFILMMYVLIGHKIWYVFR